MTATTTPPRRIEYMPLDALKPAQRNAKEHDLRAVRNSVERFGYADAAILDERTGLLLGGHGRTDALRQMREHGEPAPGGVTTGPDGTWLVPVQRGWASRDDAEAEALLIALNRTGERGGWHPKVLAEALSDLFAHRTELMVASGYGLGDLDDLLTELEELEQDTPDLYTPETTDAHYSETPEEETARAARYATQQTKATRGLVEVILVYGETDRAELQALTRAIRTAYGDPELRTSEIVLRALRVVTTDANPPAESPCRT